MSKIRSFDVFDTVLTRIVGRPEALFYFVGTEAVRRGWITCSPQRFALARVDAERQARLHARFPPVREEVEFQTIYASLAVGLQLNPERVSQLMDLELELEAAFLRPVPGSAERIQAARDQGQRVIFVSDMYLPAEFIRSQLERHGMWNAGDALYVSSEHFRCKSTGALFDILCQREQTTPANILHCGNALLPDVQAPRRKGIRAELFDDGNLNRYERLLESFAPATDGFSSLLAGAARLARLSVPAQTKHEIAIRNVGAGVAGPLLAGYVIWVLRSAQRQRIKRLYFVSRDGQILLQIAKILAPKVGYDGELRYLYGGRQAWHLPAITEFSHDVINWLFYQGSNALTPSVILHRLGIEKEEQSGCWMELGENPSTLHNSLTAGLRETLTQRLIEGPLGVRVKESAAGVRQATLAYLKQEGLAEDGDWALVDLGWTGKLQTSLGKLLSTIGIAPPRGFYFGLMERPDHTCSGELSPYFFDIPSGWGMAVDITLIAELLETFCSADHGLTVGYSRNSSTGEYQPLFKEDRTAQVLEWGLSLLHQSILETSRHLWWDSPAAHLDVDIRPATEQLLRTYWSSPAPDEARAWAKFPFEEDQAGGSWRPLTRQLNLRDAWGLFRYGKITDESVRWPHATWAMTPKLPRKAYNFVRRLGRKLRGW